MSRSRSYQKRRRWPDAWKDAWRARRDDLRSGWGRTRIPPKAKRRLAEERIARYHALMADRSVGRPTTVSPHPSVADREWKMGGHGLKVRLTVDVIGFLTESFSTPPNGCGH